MPVPLGFWAAAGAGGNAAGPSFELISTTILGSTTSLVTFSSIPATYKHLQLRFSVRGSSSTNPQMRMYFNGDTASNYNSHLVFAQNNSSFSENEAGTSINLNRVPGDLAQGSHFGVGIIDILDYASTSKNKVTRMRGGYADPNQGYFYTGLYSGQWRSTAAINSMSLFINSMSILANSRLSLYGILG